MATTTILSPSGVHSIPQAPGTSASSVVGAGAEGAVRHYNDWPNHHGYKNQDVQHAPVQLTISGVIPSYAVGTLYRTGPGTNTVETKDGDTFAISHWFDGLNHVHRFQILPPSSENPSMRVFYSSRRTTDSVVQRIRETKKLAEFTFGQKRDPCQSFFKKVMSTFAPVRSIGTGSPDSQNIGVAFSVNMPGLPRPPSRTARAEGKSENSHKVGNLVIKTDAAGYQIIDPETLEPLSIVPQLVLHPDLKGPLSATHARTCPTTGDIFNFNLEISQYPIYRIFQVSASTEKTTILATLTDAPGAYLHSFFLTQNYVVLCVWGSHYAFRGYTMLYHRNLLDAISDLDPSQPCRWYVIDRSPAKKGVVATYHSPTFYAFHTINAYEEPSATIPGQTDIVADLACYDDMSVLKRFYFENLISSSPGALDYTGQKGDSTRPWMARYRLPAVPVGSAIPQKAVKEAERLFAAPRSQSCDLPTINPAFITKPHRYVYGVADTGASTLFDSIAKFDTVTQKSVFWQYHAQSPGEPIFVADPERASEDDGVLLSVVLDGIKGKSYLLCLDAKDLSELGRASMETSIGFGFHGAHAGLEQKGRVLDQ